MEKQTVFIKRYPIRGELPECKGQSYRIYITSNKGIIYYDKYDGWEYDIEWWLDEVVLPNPKECNHPDSYLKSFQDGANFILNHLKSK